MLPKPAKTVSKRYIPLTENWLRRMAMKLTDQQVATMFEEICILRETGVLPADAQELRQFGCEIRERIQSSSMELRMAEDALLFEMSRRFYESL